MRGIGKPSFATWDLEQRALAQNFIKAWDLDQTSQQILYAQHPHQLLQVVEQFKPPHGVTDFNGRFQRFMANRENSIHDVGMGGIGDASSGPSQQEVTKFGQKWGVDNKVMQMILGMPKIVQAEIIRGFNPPPGSQNPSGRLVNYAKNLLQGHKARAKAQVMGTGDHDDEISQYCKIKGLDAGCEMELRKYPIEHARRAMNSFRPPEGTSNYNGRFISFLKKMPEDDGLGPPSKRGLGGESFIRGGGIFDKGGSGVNFEKKERSPTPPLRPVPFVKKQTIEAVDRRECQVIDAPPRTTQDESEQRKEQEDAQQDSLWQQQQQRQLQRW
eukprot:gnl/MRDRNA2_/MRDRNA2_78573_c0_seq2.p1 gnl/MRDRNA2_/MRDRNA2_78573_c0~~gnl/MRDRNA2_/MRDRNA2_78573_c0_seq2.p1  ORF type:complete len:328 (+),score=59.96 gnl/MRDRNA2_/MRDRNA2_78573_c0_seq2:82-1065(+)